MRYFTYIYSDPGVRKEFGNVTGNVYWFRFEEITEVEDADADYFVFLGSPDIGNYPFREVDINGQPVGPFPPIYPNRSSMINPKLFPTDTGVPYADEWRLITETMADPILYYHYIREKRYR